MNGPADSLEARAVRYGVPWLRAVPDAVLDPDLVARLPVEWARTHCALPIRWEGRLCVLTREPSDVQVQEDLALLLGSPLAPLLAPEDEIRRVIEQCYFQRNHSPGEFVREMKVSAGPGLPPPAKSDDLLQVADQAPVTQLINLILLEAVKARASDIHFEPFESQLRVRYRVDGVLYEKTAPPKTMENALIARLKVMGRMDIAETRLPQDGMARVRVGEREIDIRVSTVPIAEGERVVLRLLDKNTSLLPLSALGMSDGVRAGLEQVLRQSHGIVVVCGPTGSGKTTTLYAALGQMDALRRNILTIEDPIEYQLSGIGQMQVKPKIGLTFAIGLRHILRQDPDVILVGEVRDGETAEIAVSASLTGHLVLTTLHTNDAPGAILRLVDMGVERYLMADSLRAALAQRLVRRLCERCRVPAKLPETARTLAESAGMTLEQDGAWNAAGCDQCLDGYRGRTGLFELLPVGPELQEYIRGGRLDAGGTLARSPGYREMTLLRDAMAKVQAGVTSWQEVRTVLSL